MSVGESGLPVSRSRLETADVTQDSKSPIDGTQAEVDAQLRNSAAGKPSGTTGFANSPTNRKSTKKPEEGGDKATESTKSPRMDSKIDEDQLETPKGTQRGREDSISQASPHSRSTTGRTKTGGANNRKAMMLRESDRLREEGTTLMRAGDMAGAIVPLEQGINMLKGCMPEDEKAEDNSGAFRIPICQDLCLCYSKLGEWKKAMDTATDALNLCGNGDSSISQISSLPDLPPPNKDPSADEGDNRRTNFLIRRGVACSNLGPEYYLRAEIDFMEILQGDPRHRDAKRGIQYLKFLKGQLNSKKKYEKKTVIINPDEQYVGEGGMLDAELMECDTAD